MVNRILVATDGSESANRAIDYAAQRAKAESAELLIANVMGGYGLPDKALIAFADDRNILLNELLETQSAHTLAVARERAHRAGAGTVMVESRHGEIAKTIIVIAKEMNADTIVVGKHGMGGIAGLLLGSVSQKLAALSPVPLTVVP